MIHYDIRDQMSEKAKNFISQFTSLVGTVLTVPDEKILK